MKISSISIPVSVRATTKEMQLAKDAAAAKAAMDAQLKKVSTEVSVTPKPKDAGPLLKWVVYGGIAFAAYKGFKYLGKKNGN